MATPNASADAEGLRKSRSGLRSRIGRLLENVERFISEGQAEVAFETLELVNTLLMKFRDVQLCLTVQDLQDHELQNCVDLELAVAKAKAVVKAGGKRKEQTTTAVVPEHCAVPGLNRLNGSYQNSQAMYWNSHPSGISSKPVHMDVKTLVMSRNWCI
ncbi:hypothetical protein M514_10773 [Trichuris suis]|uniref:Uncharacterized protein n=1 Tax=Trichuris suis TaxID=68888 RepID=A0A085LTR5_9BILA|nr:hypothetical protein M513_10773 [Trichuris suis]KFD62292.1 hypothetical protein M514_10773 [Trichuris suis]KHJ44431.1 hypothetical protein D918_05442 [Trichuris suis]